MRQVLQATRQPRASWPGRPRSGARPHPPVHAAVGKRLARRQAATACGAGQHERVLAPVARGRATPPPARIVQLHALKATRQGATSVSIRIRMAARRRVAGEWRGWSNLPLRTANWTDANPVARVRYERRIWPSGRRAGSGSGESGRIRAVRVSCDLEWSQRRDHGVAPAPSSWTRATGICICPVGRVPRGGEAGPERTWRFLRSRRFGSARTPEVAERAQVAVI